MQAATDKALGASEDARDVRHAILDAASATPASERSRYAAMSATGGDAGADARTRAVDGGRRLLFALPAVILFVLFIAYPILWVAGQSTSSQGRGRRATASASPNYREVLATHVSGSWCATWCSGG